jgi:hypothetical protein
MKRGLAFRNEELNEFDKEKNCQVNAKNVIPAVEEEEIKRNPDIETGFVLFYKINLKMVTWSKEENNTFIILLRHYY